MIKYKLFILVSVVSSCTTGISLHRIFENSLVNETSSIQLAHQLPSSVPSESSVCSDLKAFLTAARALSPALIFGTLTYVAYVGLNILIPSTLARMDIPKIEITKTVLRSNTNSISGMDALTEELIKSLISLTETAEAAIATGKIVLRDSAVILRNVTRTAHARTLSIHSAINKLMRIFSPDCLTNYMCRIGQFTNLRFPLLGVLIRSLDNKHLDDFSQALIDGTTVGDCSGVFYECELEHD